MKYRPRSESIEAIQWTGENTEEVRNWFPEHLREKVYEIAPGGERQLFVPYRGTVTTIARSMWVIRGNDGGISWRPYGDTEFRALYEPEELRPVPCSTPTVLRSLDGEPRCAGHGGCVLVGGAAELHCGAIIGGASE